MFSEPLPSIGHGMDHIENTSYNTLPIVACAYFGHCLEMGLHVTIFSLFWVTVLTLQVSIHISGAFNIQYDM
jgi:hypothetical protein